MNLVVAALVKNEEHKFWRSALAAWKQFADHIVVLDDGSTDNTAALAEDAGAAVYKRGAGVSAWGTESPARSELWDLAFSESQPGDFIFVLDADMVPIKNPKPFLHIQPAPGSLAFPLFDLWTPDAYRTDGFWQGHRHPRTWMVQRPAEVPPEGWLWPARGIHCGHFPTNLQTPEPHLILPQAYGLLHYAYSTPGLRESKARSYEAVAAQLTKGEQQHAISIMHPNPDVRDLPFIPSYPLEMTPLDDQEEEAADLQHN